MRSKTKKTVIAALMAALICVATMMLKIPTSLRGYINLGDGIVLLAAWILSAGYGFFAAGIGSALADILSGYVTYAPATFIIKGTMVIIAFVSFKLMNKRIGKLSARIIGGVSAEVFMVAGYFLFEGFMYGFASATVNILPNAMQGAVGVILGIILPKVFEKANITAE